MLQRNNIASQHPSQGSRPGQAQLIGIVAAAQERLKGSDCHPVAETEERR